ncbi:MAG: hypothetical protein JNG89_20145 [Planctomycetaceae bacterium]|nr:hypothetical protein [Planctomycetaceae bacterium]
METSLHRQLKELYAGDAASREVRLDGFRIDAIADGQLIEIQSAPLGAIRDKVRTLVQQHDVLVIKPLAARKTLIKLKRKNGKVLSTRTSPRRETVCDLFSELVNFVPLFPHPRLTLDVLLTEQEEHRVPVKKRRRRGKDYRVLDRRLVQVVETHRFRTADDVLALLPEELPASFTTADIAKLLKIPRWLAQKMTYCLRRMEAVNVIGVSQRSRLYERRAA